MIVSFLLFESQALRRRGPDKLLSNRSNLRTSQGLGSNWFNGKSLGQAYLLCHPPLSQRQGEVGRVGGNTLRLALSSLLAVRCGRTVKKASEKNVTFM